MEILIGKTKTNTEIFDFDNYDNELKIIKYDQIVKYNIDVCLGNLINFVEDNKQYYIIGLILTRDDQAFFYLIKFYLYFDSNNKILCESIDSETKPTVDNGVTYCHLSNKNDNILICIYLPREKDFTIIFVNKNLDFEQEQTLPINYNYTSYKLFFKFFPFEDDIFIFTYYQNIDDAWRPTIQIVEETTNETSYSVDMIGNPIILNKFDFNSTNMLTDIIIIKENLLCLSSAKKGKESLIIVLINFYNDMDYNIRYYLIDFFNLYKHKFLHEMKLHLYNEYIMLGFSFCRNDVCDNDNNQHHASLIIFSYPNITNDNLDLIDYLKKEGNNNIILNLFDNVKIDNNIFGYIVYGIKIHSIDDCQINFISDKINETIHKDYILSKNETIHLLLSESEYEIKTCSLKYRAIITEPDYDEYNQYPYYILKESNEDEKSSFSTNLYIGRVGKYDIEINEQLVTNCGEENINCNLCLKTNKSYCFICKYDYIFINNMKICNKTESPNYDTTETPNYDSTETPNYDSTETPNYDTTETPKFDTTETPNYDSTETPNYDSTETPKFDSTETPKFDTTEIPNYDTTEIPIYDTTETSKFDTTESPNYDTTETPNYDSTETPKFDTTEIPNYDSTAFTNNDETEILSTNVKLGNCEIKKIAKGNCPDNTLSNDELKEMYYYIKGEIITVDYNYENIIIPTSDIYFQISSLEEQKNSNYDYLSSVDLKECEKILRDVNHIEDDEPLIILKMDFKNKEDSTTYVKYEIYNPYNLDLLELSCCDKSNIIINVPVNLDSETISLYDNLNQNGYNLFNPNDSFYNDICTTYKSDNGTDISLSDRQKSFYNKKGNKSLCQNGCVFEEYIIEKKK